MSGSEANRLRKVTMEDLASNMASSIQTSTTWAPFSTCSLATVKASSYCSSFMRRAKRLEPDTLVRSPTLIKLLDGSMVKGSRPLTRVTGLCLGSVLGLNLAAVAAMAAMCAGRVPQQPPTMLIHPFSRYFAKVSAIVSGVSSYSPNWLGRPALG